MTAARDVPVVVFLFNRPETLARVVDLLRCVQPRLVMRYRRWSAPRLSRRRRTLLRRTQVSRTVRLALPCTAQLHGNEYGL